MHAIAEPKDRRGRILRRKVQAWTEHIVILRLTYKIGLLGGFVAYSANVEMNTLSRAGEYSACEWLSGGID